MAPQADTTLDAQCKEAREAGILVVNIFDSTMQEADLYVGNISLDTGRLAAQWICEDWCKDRLQLLKVFREHMLLSTVPQDSLRYVKNMTELKLLLT